MVLTGVVSIPVTPYMRSAAYEVLSKWYSQNTGATTGMSMLQLANDMLEAGLKASNKVS